MLSISRVYPFRINSWRVLSCFGCYWCFVFCVVACVVVLLLVLLLSFCVVRHSSPCWHDIFNCAINKSYFVSSFMRLHVCCNCVVRRWFIDWTCLCVINCWSQAKQDTKYQRDYIAHFGSILWQFCQIEQAHFDTTQRCNKPKYDRDLINEGLWYCGTWA